MINNFKDIENSPRMKSLFCKVLDPYQTGFVTKNQFEKYESTFGSFSDTPFNTLVVSSEIFKGYLPFDVAEKLLMKCSPGTYFMILSFADNLFHIMYRDQYNTNKMDLALEKEGFRNLSQPSEKTSNLSNITSKYSTILKKETHTDYTSPWFYGLLPSNVVEKLLIQQKPHTFLVYIKSDDQNEPLLCSYKTENAFEQMELTCKDAEIISFGKKKNLSLLKTLFMKFHYLLKYSLIYLILLDKILFVEDFQQEYLKKNILILHLL